MFGNGFNIFSYFNLLIGVVIYYVKEGNNKELEKIC